MTTEPTLLRLLKQPAAPYLEPMQPRKIFQIAADIKAAWPNTFYAAKPYLDAMCQLETIDQQYGFDSARGIVIHFLSNASNFRGEEARRLKAELKALL